MKKFTDPRLMLQPADSEIHHAPISIVVWEYRLVEDHMPRRMAPGSARQAEKNGRN